MSPLHGHDPHGHDPHGHDPHGHDLPRHHCPGCDAERPFEVPPCADTDDHPLDGCPDLACTQCGYALAGGAAPAPLTLPRAA